MAMAEPKSVEDARDELKEMYSRLGWKWAVLASMAGRAVSAGKQLPADFMQELSLTRTELESGCISVCDVTSDLRDLEVKLFDVLLGISEGEVHAMLELISKAMNGSMEEADIDIEPIKVVLSDCSIPGVCSSRSKHEMPPTLQ